MLVGLLPRVLEGAFSINHSVCHTQFTPLFLIDGRRNVLEVFTSLTSWTSSFHVERV
jgi:hypothetical protein